MILRVLEVSDTTLSFAFVHSTCEVVVLAFALITNLDVSLEEAVHSQMPALFQLT